MFRNHSRLHRLALWLALSGTLLRGLIPVGFMPAMTTDAEARGSAILVLCSGGVFKASKMAISQPRRGWRQ